MYIEQLTKRDFERFAIAFDCGVYNVKKSDNNKIYLQLFTGAMGPQPEMWISDFDLTTSSSYKFAEKQLKKQYVLFMNKKFGERYHNDYTENYNNQVEEDRII